MLEDIKDSCEQLSDEDLGKVLSHWWTVNPMGMKHWWSSTNVDTEDCDLDD